MINEFKVFIHLMEREIERHNKDYKDSWKTISLGKLQDRLDIKCKEFDLTLNKNKLISIANLAMMLYTRMEEK